MRFCNTCRRRRVEGASFCAGCGSPFPDASPWELPPPQDPPGPGPGPGPGGAAPATGLDDLLDGPPPRRQRSRPPLVLAAAAVVVVALAAGGTIGIMSAGHGPRRASPAAAGSPGRTASGAPAAAISSSPLAGTSPAGAPATPASSSPAASARPVVMAASLAGNPQAPPILALLDRYFAAINRHDYQGVITLFSPQAQESVSAGQFINGFLSTRDSAETLTGISTDTAGRTVAMVAFTSHQAPANSVDHREACTNWRISLFLQRQGSSYLIGLPPAGYAASYASCQ